MRNLKTVLLLDGLFLASLSVFAATREWVHRSARYEFVWPLALVWGMWGVFSGAFGLLWLRLENSIDGIPSRPPETGNRLPYVLKLQRYQWTALPYIFVLGAVYSRGIAVTPMMKIWWPLLAGILVTLAWHWQVWRRFGTHKA